VFHRDPNFTDDRADQVHPIVSFPHELFRWRKGLGAIKGRIYALLTKPMTAAEIAAVLRYKYVRNVRIHLSELTNRGLVGQLPDSRFERGDRDLDELAQELGVAGSNERQRARHVSEQSAFRAYARRESTGCALARLSIQRAARFSHQEVDREKGRTCAIFAVYCSRLGRVPQRSRLQKAFGIEAKARERSSAPRFAPGNGAFVSKSQSNIRELSANCGRINETQGIEAPKNGSSGFRSLGSPQSSYSSALDLLRRASLMTFNRGETPANRKNS
jgi:hypothetical protein